MNEEYNFIQPDHYKKLSFEIIDMLVKLYGEDRVADFCEMNVIKYRMRMGNKPGEDLDREFKKISWYEQKAADLRKIAKDRAKEEGE